MKQSIEAKATIIVCSICVVGIGIYYIFHGIKSSVNGSFHIVSTYTKEMTIKMFSLIILEIYSKRA